MKEFPTFGLLQVFFVFVSNVHGTGDGLRDVLQYAEQYSELYKEAIESTSEILKAHNSTSLTELHHLIYGVQTLMIYLNSHAPFEHAGVKFLKKEVIHALNIMNREMQICLDGYSGVLKIIVDTVSTSEKITVRNNMKQEGEIEQMKHRLISAKSLYLNECTPLARTAAVNNIKSRILMLLESKELDRVLEEDGKQAVTASEKLQQKINTFLTKLDNVATKGKSLIISEDPHIVQSYRQYPRYNIAEDIKKRIDECHETARGTFEVNLDELFLHLSSIKSFCADLPSSKCKFIMDKVVANVVSPSFELIEVMLAERKYEVYALFKICVYAALLNKNQDSNFSA